MSTQSTAGTTLGLSASAPATYNAAGFAALTFTNVGEIKNLGEFGKTFALITSSVLSRRGDRKKKGSFNAGQLSFSVELDNADTGQTLLQTALDADADYSVAVTLQNGDAYYLRGLVVKFTPAVGGNSEMVMANVTIELQAFDDSDGDEVASIFDAA